MKCALLPLAGKTRVTARYVSIVYRRRQSPIPSNAVASAQRRVTMLKLTPPAQQQWLDLRRWALQQEQDGVHLRPKFRFRCTSVERRKSRTRQS
jgi:hypothetical protein